MKKNKNIGVRIDPELHYKLHYISRYDGRTANGMIIFLANRAIAEFEKEHGKIEIPPEINEK